MRKDAYELQPHQQRVLDRLKAQQALLVYHGLGSGKTLTALAAANELGMPATVVGPASLQFHYKGERRKHGIRSPVRTYTYNKPPEKLSDKALLVFDEAHRMGRMDSQRSRLVDKLRGAKELYLTGTPIRNEPAELIPIMRGLGVDVPRDKAAFEKEYTSVEYRYPGLLARLLFGARTGEVKVARNLDKLKGLLRGKVDWHPSAKENFPEVEERTIEVEMSPEQEAAHSMAMTGYPALAYKIRKGMAPSKSELRQLNAFMSASRQISNIPGGFNLKATAQDAPKIDRAFKEIEKRYRTNPNYRGVTYSAYREHGIEPLAAKLDQAGIPYAMFTGDQPQKEREQIVKAYNEGKIKQLLVTGAGGEGIDLKGTRLFQLMEPHWNEPQLDQAVGRAVRYMSHEHLPKQERKVEVQRYVAVPRPKGWLFSEREKGTDEYLAMLAQDKERLNEQFLKALQEVGKQPATKTTNVNLKAGATKMASDNGIGTSAYVASGEVQGVGLRRTFHDILDRAKLPGVAVNDSGSGRVLLQFGEQVTPESQARAMDALLKMVQRKTGKTVELVPVKAAPLVNVRITPEDQAKHNATHFMGFMRSDRAVPNERLGSLAKVRKDMIERFRLRRKKGGVLVGAVPSEAIPQLKGDVAMYQWMQPDKLVRSTDEAMQLMVPEDRTRIAKLMKQSAAATLPADPSALAPFAVFAVAKLRRGRLAATTRAADRGEAGRIGLPGGKVDSGESPAKALEREAAEEGWRLRVKSSEPLHKALVDGRPVWWFEAEEPTKLSDYKEKHRGIRPVAALRARLAASGYGNEFLAPAIPKQAAAIPPASPQDRVQAAIALAKQMHGQQTRRFTTEPYWTHPERVALRLRELYPEDEDLAVAGAAHDILEDVPGATEQQLVQQIGAVPASLVKEVSNPEYPAPMPPRAKRREMERAHLATVSRRAKLLKLVDRLDNLRDLSVADPKWAKRYLGESELLAGALKGTDQKLEDELMESIAKQRKVIMARMPKQAGLLTPEQEQRIIADYYSKMTDPSHGYEQHVAKVRQLAMDLATRRKLPSRQVAALDVAALMHDITRESDTSDTHHETGAAETMRLLGEMKVRRAKQIADMVRLHRASSPVPPNISEAHKILRDADRLAGVAGQPLLLRAYQYGLKSNPNKEISLLRALTHVYDKYGPGGYGMEALHFPESKTKIQEEFDKVRNALRQARDYPGGELQAPMLWEMVGEKPPLPMNKDAGSRLRNSWDS